MKTQVLSKISNRLVSLRCHSPIEIMLYTSRSWWNHTYSSQEIIAILIFCHREQIMHTWSCQAEYIASVVVPVLHGVSTHFICRKKCPSCKITDFRCWCLVRLLPWTMFLLSCSKLTFLYRLWTLRCFVVSVLQKLCGIFLMFKYFTVTTDTMSAKLFFSSQSEHQRHSGPFWQRKRNCNVQKVQWHF